MEETLLEKARRLRSIIEKLSQSMLNEDVTNGKELFPKWKALENYPINFRVNYNGVLYRSLVAHKALEPWYPSDSPSIWAITENPNEEFPQWIQWNARQIAYNLGEKVTYNELHYISIVADNVWAPDQYGWELYE